MIFQSYHHYHEPFYLICYHEVGSGSVQRKRYTNPPAKNARILWIQRLDHHSLPGGLYRDPAVSVHIGRLLKISLINVNYLRFTYLLMNNVNGARHSMKIAFQKFISRQPETFHSQENHFLHSTQRDRVAVWGKLAFRKKNEKSEIDQNKD